MRVQYGHPQVTTTSFASYINDLGLSDEDGNTLELAEGGEGSYTSGTYYEKVRQTTKDVGAFDALDRSAAENYVFGTSETDALHFDATMAELLKDNGDTYAGYSDYDSSYASAYADDLTSLALAQGMRKDVNDVDFATVWGLGHTTAERTGSAADNFIAWVQECCG